MDRRCHRTTILGQRTSGGTAVTITLLVGVADHIPVLARERRSWMHLLLLTVLPSRRSMDSREAELAKSDSIRKMQLAITYLPIPLQQLQRQDSKHQHSTFQTSTTDTSRFSTDTIRAVALVVAGQIGSISAMSRTNMVTTAALLLAVPSISVLTLSCTTFSMKMAFMLMVRALPLKDTPPEEN